MSDLQTDLRQMIRSAAEPITVEEVIARAAGQNATPPPGMAASHSRRFWWAAAAAVLLVVVAGAASLAWRHEESMPPTVSTPDGPVVPDSYPTNGRCGGERLTNAVSLAGPASADLCLGLLAYNEAEGTNLVYLTSATGDRVYGGWAIGACTSYYDSAGGQIRFGDDASPVTMIGVVPPDVAAIQIHLADGTTLTAKTVTIDSVDDAAFYSVVVPAIALIPAQRVIELDADGTIAPAGAPSCTPQTLALPTEVAKPIAASFIAESSRQRGIVVGDPCPDPDADASSAATPMDALISQISPGGPCLVVGWSPHEQLPGLDPGYYAQDGSLIRSLLDRSVPYPNATTDLVGQSAPAVSGTTATGDTIDLQALRGRWVVLDPYATWCEPCQPVAEQLAQLKAQRPDIEIVSLAATDDLEQVTSALQQMGANWPAIPLLFTDGVQTSYRFDKLPDTVLIDPNGIVRAVYGPSNPATARSIDADSR